MGRSKRRSLFDVAKTAKWDEEQASSALLRQSLLGGQGDAAPARSPGPPPAAADKRRSSQSGRADNRGVSGGGASKKSAVEEYQDPSKHAKLNKPGVTPVSTTGLDKEAGSGKGSSIGRRISERPKTPRRSARPYQVPRAPSPPLASDTVGAAGEISGVGTAPKQNRRRFGSFGVDERRESRGSGDWTDIPDVLEQGRDTGTVTTTSRKTLSWNIQGDDGHFLDKWDLQFTPSRRNLIALLIAFTIIALTFDSLSIKASAGYGHMYRIFRVLWMYFTFCILCGAVVLTKMVTTDDITEEVRNFPKSYLLGLGALDALAEFLFYAGAEGTPPVFQELITQSSFIVVVLLTLWVTRRRFNWMQVLGLSITFGGLVLALSQRLFASAEKVVDWTIVGPILYGTALIPFSFSLAVKDKIVCIKTNYDIFYIALWISIGRLLSAWVLVPLHVIAPLGKVHSIEEIGRIIRDGILCFLGDESTPILNSHNETIGHCSETQTWITIFLVPAEFLTTILMLTILKHSSAVVLVLFSALRVPLVRITRMSEAIFQTKAVGFSIYPVIAIPVILLGIVIYMWRASELREDFHTKFRACTAETLARARKRRARQARRREQARRRAATRTHDSLEQEKRRRNRPLGPDDEADSDGFGSSTSSSSSSSSGIAPGVGIQRLFVPEEGE